jgi:Putative Actinobacterial Holin-X, holin superfamily III
MQTSSPPAPQEMSLGELASAVSSDAAELARGEVRLAIKELQKKGTLAGVGIGLMGAAGITALFGAAALTVTVIAALALAMATWLAALIVALGLFFLASVLGLVGKKRTARALPPTPRRAVAGAQDDISRVREEIRR